MVQSFRRFTLPLAALVAATLVGCGGSSTTPQEEAVAKLNAAYDSYGVGNIPETMANLSDSISAEVSPDALLMQAQVEWLRGDVDASQATIAQYKVLYPASGTADLFQAFAQDSVDGDCDVIYQHLDAARALAASGTECNDFWNMVESDPEAPNPNFAYFRDSCPAQFATLEAQKSCPLEAPGATCKENVSKWVNHGWGPTLYIDHGATTGIKVASYLVSFVAKFVPGFWAKVITTAISVELKRTTVFDRGCGIKLQWLWPQLSSPGTALLYWVDKQK